MAKNSGKSGGIGICGALFLIFVTLKLTDHIDWSWWWVTAPIWGVFAVAAGIWLVALMLFGVAKLLELKSK